MSLIDRLFGSEPLSPRERELLDFVASLQDEKDSNGLPFYWWGDIRAALTWLKQNIKDKSQHEFLLQSAFMLARYKGDPCWLITDIVQELTSFEKINLADYLDTIKEIVQDMTRYSKQHDLYRRERILGEPRVHWWFEETAREENPGYLMPYQLLLHLFLPLIRRLAGVGRNKLTPERFAHAWSITRSIARIVDVGCSEINFLVHNSLHNIIDHIPSYTPASSELLVKFAGDINDAYKILYASQPDRLLLADVWTSLTGLFSKRDRNLGLARIRDVAIGDSGDTEELVTAALLFQILREFHSCGLLGERARALAETLDKMPDDEQFRLLTFLRRVLLRKETSEAAKSGFFSILAAMKDGVPEMKVLSRVRRSLEKVSHISKQEVQFVISESPDVSSEKIELCAGVETSLLSGAEISSADSDLLLMSLSALSESHHPQRLGFTWDDPMLLERRVEKNPFAADDFLRGLLSVEAPLWKTPVIPPIVIPVFVPRGGAQRIKPSSDKMKKFLENLLARFYKVKSLLRNTTEDCLWHFFIGGLQNIPPGRPLPIQWRGYFKSLRERVVGGLKDIQKDFLQENLTSQGYVVAYGINAIEKLLQNEPMRFAHWAESLAVLAEISTRDSMVRDAVLPVLAQSLLEFGAFSTLLIGLPVMQMESVEEMNLTALSYCRLVIERVAKLVHDLKNIPQAGDTLRSCLDESLSELSEKIKKQLGLEHILREIKYVNEFNIALEHQSGEIRLAPAPPIIVSIKDILGLTNIITPDKDSPSDNVHALMIVKLPENVFLGLLTYAFTPSPKIELFAIKEFWPRGYQDYIARDMLNKIHPHLIPEKIL